MMNFVDTSFRFDLDTPVGKDPDTYCRTLRDYHNFLWSKPLPHGESFLLTASNAAPYYLYHSSDLGTFRLSSDSFGHTYMRHKPMANIVNSIPKNELDEFWNIACTIGGYIIFPANRINNCMTINVARGFNKQIGDRFDLTLECIRRWYMRTESPLVKCLNTYHSFFELFVDFQGYIKFFLLDDLINEKTGEIRYWLPFTGFDHYSNPLPANEFEYSIYMRNLMSFIKMRNTRIAGWSQSVKTANSLLYNNFIGDYKHAH